MNYTPIPIRPDRHIGLLFNARTGSTVLRNYFKQVLKFVDLAEMFNHYVKRVKIDFKALPITAPPRDVLVCSAVTMPANSSNETPA